VAQFVGGEVALSGTTWTQVVAAPASGKQRQVLSLLVKNRDSVQHTIVGRKKKSASTYEQLTLDLAAGLPGQLISNCVVLDGTDESYEVKSNATATTTEPLVDVAFFEVP
jgi:hypothetical protein